MTADDRGMNRKLALALALSVRAAVGCGAPAAPGGPVQAGECAPLGSPARDACGAALSALQGCCFDGLRPVEAFRAMTAESLCRGAVERGEDPVTSCGAFGRVAGDCGGARLYAARGIGTGELACCCAAGSACEGDAARGYVCR